MFEFHSREVTSLNASQPAAVLTGGGARGVVSGGVMPIASLAEDKVRFAVFSGIARSCEGEMEL